MTLGFAALAGVAGAQEISPSLVRIRAVDANAGVKFGTGVVTAPGQVATACHVTRGAASIGIQHAGGWAIAAAETGSQVHDLCVLTASLDAVPVAPLRRSADLQPGESVIAMGFEGGRRIIVKEGHVAALYPYDDGLVIRTDAAFDFGASGGGLFDQSGNLIGILSFKARTGENLRFALPTEWLAPGSRVAATFVPITTDSAEKAFWELAQGDRPAFLGAALREADASPP